MDWRMNLLTPLQVSVFKIVTEVGLGPTSHKLFEFRSRWTLPKRPLLTPRRRSPTSTLLGVPMPDLSDIATGRKPHTPEVDNLSCIWPPPHGGFSRPPNETRMMYPSRVSLLTSRRPPKRPQGAVEGSGSGAVGFTYDFSVVTEKGATTDLPGLSLPMPSTTSWRAEVKWQQVLRGAGTDLKFV
jgi:hypothetical protein